MNNLNIREIIKFVLICILLIMFSPIILGIFGFVVKSLFVLVIIIAVIVGTGILYLKYKANKITKQYYSKDDSFSQSNNSNHSNTQPAEDESVIDYSDTTIIDVDYQEDHKED